MVALRGEILCLLSTIRVIALRGVGRTFDLQPGVTELGLLKPRTRQSRKEKGGVAAFDPRVMAPANRVKTTLYKRVVALYRFGDLAFL